MLDPEDFRQRKMLPDVTYAGVVYVGHLRQPYVIIPPWRNFLELRQGEVRRIYLPRTPVNNARESLEGALLKLECAVAAVG